MDFQLGDLSLTRSYNSLSPYDQGLGVGWSSNLLENISIDGTEIIVREPSGQSEMFNFDAINSTWMGDADTDLLLSESQDFTVTRQNGTQKQYDTNGKLLSVTTAGGKSTEYTYNNEGQTTQINDHFGRTITISWSLSHVDNVTDPLGNRHQYDYDVNWNLIGVTNPDRSTKTYHYENTNFPHHLTGITDENDHRYATFAFDSQGRAIRTEHADIGGGGAQEKLQFDYGLQRGQGQ
jgi:YD repeat-containing protein